MTKIVIVPAIILLLTLAVLRSCIPTGTATLLIHVYIEENEIEITDRIRLLVGYVPEGRRGPPTLGNIRLIGAEDGTKNKFLVPSLQKIGIFAIRSGGEPFSDVVWLESGEKLEHRIVLKSTP